MSQVGKPRPKHGIGLCAYIALAVSACFFLVYLGMAMWPQDVLHGMGYTEWNHHINEADQYALLADSLLNGRLTLDLPVPDELRELEDPYDYDARYEIGSPEVPIYWDHAYYDGNYYSYFGVVPAVLLYVPYQFLTGNALDTVTANVVFGCCAIAAMALLVWRIRDRWFHEASDGAVCLSFIACFNGSYAAYLVSVPRFYSIPIISGLALLFLGLWFWIGARVPFSGISGKGPAPLSSGRLCGGSICLALILGCRPQLCLVWLLAFPLFWSDVFRDRTLFSTRSIAQSVAVLAPFSLIGLILAWYNTARFGSPFDFGAYYNLTGHNMTTYTQRLLLTLLQVLLVFFAPLNFQAQAPYFFPSSNYAGYVGDALGWAPTEPIFGGYVWAVPTTPFILATPWVWMALRRKGLAAFIPLLVALSVFLCAFDAHSAGTSERYMADFGWALSLAAIFVFLALSERKGTQATIAMLIFSVSSFIGLGLCVWGIIAPTLIGIV